MVMRQIIMRTFKMKDTVNQLVYILNISNNLMVMIV